MNKADFIQNYIEKPTEKAIARVMLSEGDRTLEEWRRTFRLALSTPVKHY